MSVIQKDKATVAKVIRTREGIEAFRAEVMKCYPLKRHIKTSEFLTKYKLETSTINYLKEMKVIEDHTPAGTLKRDGKLLKWIYTKSGENGVVDGQLVEELIEKHRVYQREWNRANRGVQELIHTVVGYVTPEKSKGASGIIE